MTVLRWGELGAMSGASFELDSSWQLHLGVRACALLFGWCSKKTNNDEDAATATHIWVCQNSRSPTRSVGIGVCFAGMFQGMFRGVFRGMFRCMFRAALGIPS